AKSSERELIGRKLSDLGEIYKAYIAFLERGYICKEELLGLLAQKLPETAFGEGAAFFLDGFHEFSMQELSVLQGLMKRAESMSIALTMDEQTFYMRDPAPTADYYPTRRTLYALDMSAKEAGQKTALKLVLGEDKRHSEALSSLEREFFKIRPTPSKTSQGVSIYAARNKYDEVEDAAQSILKLTEEGLRFRDIAVVARGTESYAEAIENIFSEYEIPFFMDRREDVRSHPVVRTLMSIIDMILHDFAYEDVFSYLRTNFSPISREECDELENFVLANGIKGFKWRSADPKRAEDAEYMRMRELMERSSKAVLELYEKLAPPVRMRAKKIGEELFSALESLGVRDRLSAMEDEFLKSGELRAAREQRAAYEGLLDAARKLAEILGDEKLSLAEYSDILSAGLSRCDIGAIPAMADMVSIGDIERSRMPKIKALFVLGVNEGVLPGPKLPTGVFTDAETLRLEELSGGTLKSAKSSAFDENFLIYQGLLQPSEYIRLSFSLGDGRGAGMRPSVLIRKIMKIFPDIEIEEPKEAEKTTERMALRARAAQKMLGKLPQPEENLPKESAQKLYGNGVFLSPTALNTYAACPFSHFARYVLGAKERRIYRLDAPDIGTLLHAAIERFSRDVAEEGRRFGELSAAETDERTDAIVDEISPQILSDIFVSGGGYAYLLKRLKDMARAAVRAVCAQVAAGDFEPEYFELGFGKHELLPAIALERGKGGISLGGKIDRVDILKKDERSFIKIVDYKTGSKSFSADEVYHGIESQLLLYLGAFLETGQGALSAGNNAPGGVFYFRIRNPFIKTRRALTRDELSRAILGEFRPSGLLLSDPAVVYGLERDAAGRSEVAPFTIGKNGALDSRSSAVSEEDFRRLIARCRKNAELMGRRMRAGEISAAPYVLKKKTSCGYCPYKGLCAFDPTLGHRYRRLAGMSAKEVWKRLGEEEE
ncbi:MAG: exodeoxyribonuclease V subunit gamma, partial [Firmicutes bacterium]|nr:exodeoxyribonuclease V subunit gamma [Bacillota bacterium]